MIDTSASEPPSLDEFWAHVNARRLGATVIFAIVLAGAMAISAGMPPQYRATASLAVMPAPEFTVREDAGSRAFSSSALAMDQIMKTETEILQSDDLHEATIIDIGGKPNNRRTPAESAWTLYPDLDPAIKPGLISWSLMTVLHTVFAPWRSGHAANAIPMDQALRRYADHLHVLPAKDSNVISVSFSNSNATIAAAVLNTMLARYADQRQRLYDDPQLAVAVRETEILGAAVRGADMKLSLFKAAHGYSDYAVERELLLKRRSQAFETLAEAEASQAQSSARLGALGAQIKALPSSTGIYQESDTDTRLQTVDNNLADLHSRLVAARQHYRDRSRMVTELQSRITGAENDRKRIAGNREPSVKRSGRSLALDPLLVARAQAGADRDAAGAQIGSVRNEIDDLGVQLRTLNADETTLADLSRRKSTSEDSFNTASRVVAEQKLTEAEDARRLTNVRVIQPARIPQHATPLRLLICLAGLILGAMGAGAWLVLNFMLRTTFLTAAGLQHATGLPVLGVVPRRLAELQTVPG